MTPFAQLGEMEKSAANRLVKLLRAGKLSSPARERAHEGSATWRNAAEGYLDDFATPTQKFYSMAMADRKNHIKTLTSGRHVPRPGEVVVTAAYNGEEIGGDTPFSNFIFKGSRGVTSGPNTFFSRHPDVAGNYAMNRRADNPRKSVRIGGEMNTGFLLDTNARVPRHVGPGMKLHAYRPGDAQFADQATGSPEGPSIKDTRAYLQDRPRLRLPGNGHLLKSDGALNSSYESVLLAGRPRWVGSYDVRHVRGGDGMPAMALSDYKGLHAAKLVHDKPPGFLENLKNLKLVRS